MAYTVGELTGCKPTELKNNKNVRVFSIKK